MSNGGKKMNEFRSPEEMNRNAALAAATTLVSSVVQIQAATGKTVEVKEAVALVLASAKHFDAFLRSGKISL